MVDLKNIYNFDVEFGSLEQYLEKLCNETVAEIYSKEDSQTFDAIIRTSSNPTFGHYQCNGVMSFAKRKGLKPFDCAKEIADKINEKNPTYFLKPCEVAGAGFINFFINDETIFEYVKNQTIPKINTKEEIIVEYGSENIAKELHVGHMRGQIIGDSIARLMQKIGFDVIQDNHIGDWGTQFGMLIEMLLTDDQYKTALEDLELNEIDKFYVAAKTKFSEDEEFAKRARARVGLLQSGDRESLKAWETFSKISIDEILKLYKQFDITLKLEDFRGESFYNPLLGEVCQELEDKGIAQISDGALVIYTEGENDRDGNPFGLIIRKSDGGYGYATTDLATIKYRIQNFDAKTYLYVVDTRQSQHFRMVFDAAKKAGWTKDRNLFHVNYGTIQGKDGGAFKTRDGNNIKLKELLNEAQTRAEHLILSKNPSNSEASISELAKKIGFGALKYGDLSSQRIKNYVFDWDKMLSFDGNTAPYIQYAHARICSILDKNTDIEFDTFSFDTFETPQERSLALKIIEYSSAILDTTNTVEPHKLCTYLFNLAQFFTSFYEACNITNSIGDVKKSRLFLSNKTKNIISEGLYILGIASPEKL